MLIIDVVVAVVLAVVVAAGFYTLADGDMANSVFLGVLSMVISLVISVMSRRNAARSHRRKSSGHGPR